MTMRPILAAERSGILHPEHLARYSAGWITPDSAVSAVVDQYWHVSWSLEEGEQIDQRIIDLPAVTLTVEAGAGFAPLVVTGVQTKAWRRTIHGVGEVFAIRLRPAGLAVVSELSPGDIANSVVPLTTEIDARAHSLMNAVAAGAQPADKARAADRAIHRMLAERAPAQAGVLANEVLDELRSRIRSRAGLTLANHVRRSERTVQRALIGTLGHGPKWISRRIRLQEVAHALVFRPSEDLATIAAELGYTDQSHLAADFRSATGMTPSAYRGAVKRLQSEAGEPM